MVAWSVWPRPYVYGMKVVFMVVNGGVTVTYYQMLSFDPRVIYSANCWVETYRGLAVERAPGVWENIGGTRP